MADFLLELLSEEIPARMQDAARADLVRLFESELAKAGLKAASVHSYATPRRLALIAKGLPIETEAVSEETKGPKVGAPAQALEGFLRKTGLTQDQLVEREGVYFAVVEKPGRRTTDVLTDAIPAIVRAFPWPKSMRWGAASLSTESLRWVRPLQGIVALLGDDLVACDVEGIKSARMTMGHRFHSKGVVTIGSAASYAADLRAAHVIVDQDERRALIRENAAKAAADAGLVLVEDEGLVVENSGLTEWPVPMLGRFDPAFLSVPEEVIQLTARINQKYFICRDAGGKLANAFVCTANIVANDGGKAIVAGNEKVLAARLSDAKFFWEQDLKIPLDEQAEKLEKIVFHEKLGTVADKVERVAMLARWLVETGVVPPLHVILAEAGISGGKGAPEAHKTPASAGVTNEERVALAIQAERAARLAKADLVTGMVGEFPELQGVMGGYYARAQGEADAVADAVRDHYKPVGQGDEVPTAPVTVAVSLADKLDTLACFFLAEMPPTGSKDPYALRRAGLAVIAIVSENRLRLPLAFACIQSMPRLLGRQRGVEAASATFAAEDALERLSVAGVQVDREKIKAGLFAQTLKEGDWLFDTAMKPALQSLLDFFADRLKVQQREAGVRHDLIDAVFALGGEDDLVRLLARVKALQSFMGTEDGANLLAGYKRAANILKQADISPLPFRGGAGGGVSQRETASVARPHPNPSPEGEGLGSLALQSALATAEPKARAAVEGERFEEAMTALASLRAPIDAFFDGVMVNDPDPNTRAFRLGLLVRFRDAVHQVADFSCIEG